MINLSLPSSFRNTSLSKKENHLPLHHGQKKRFHLQPSNSNLSSPTIRLSKCFCCPTDLVQNGYIYHPLPLKNKPDVFCGNTILTILPWASMGFPTFSTSARANAFSASESSSCKPRCAAEASVPKKKIWFYCKQLRGFKRIEDVIFGVWCYIHYM